MKKLLSMMLVILMALSLTACSNEKTYKGTARGYSSDIEVSLSLKDNTITKLEVVSSEESADIGEKALPILVDNVLKSNSLDVDVVASATVTSEAFLLACENALKEAGLTKADLSSNGANDGEVKTETKDVDVVVIGAGGAGMTAAITAAQEGKTVLVLEKAEIVGGNTSRATGGMNAAKTTFQDNNEFDQASGIEKTLEKAAEYPELRELAGIVAVQFEEYKANPVGYFDSPELFMLDTMVGGKNLNNPELVKTMVENSADAIDWLASLNKAINLTDVSSFGGASVKRIHRPVTDEGKTIPVGSYMIPLLEENCKDLGIEIITGITAKNLVVENNQVVGVKALSSNLDLTVNAKAVVLATGGFAGNLEMVVEYKPELAGFITTNAPTIQGDGIVMAKEAGAALVDMEQIQIHPTVHQETSSLITEGLRGDGAILVNQKGERFCDEVGTRDAVSAAEIAQEGSYAYLIVDSKMVEKSAVIGGYIKKGFTIGGGDVVELASAIGCDEATLQATLDKWNENVAQGSDAEFGRTSFAEALDTAPYYAIKVAPGVHHTMGGVMINTNTEVLNEAGEVIPGLFAAGEVTGGVHGANRLGGNAVADIVVYGRIAGMNAANFAK